MGKPRYLPQSVTNTNVLAHMLHTLMMVESLDETEGTLRIVKQVNYFQYQRTISVKES